MQFNNAIGSCPNCRTRPPSIWWRLIGWHWLLPLGIGVTLQIVSQHAGPEQGGPGVDRLPEMAAIGQFVAGALVLAAAAALLLFVFDRLRLAVLRKHGVQHRRDGRR